MSWKMKDTMQVYETIIRSQLIPVPIIRQLGPVDQHMLSNHFPVVPSLKTSFLLYSSPSPKLLGEQQAPGDPALQFFSALVKKLLESFANNTLREKAHAEDSKGEWRKPGQGRTQKEQSSGLPILWVGYGQEIMTQRVKTAAMWSGISHLTSLCLSFLLCKIGIITVPTLQGY